MLPPAPSGASGPEILDPQVFAMCYSELERLYPSLLDPSTSTLKAPHPSTSTLKAPHPSTSALEAPHPSTSELEAPHPSTSTINACFNKADEIQLLKEQFNQSEIAQPDGVEWIRKMLRRTRLNWNRCTKSWVVKAPWAKGRRRVKVFPVIPGREDYSLYQALSCRDREFTQNPSVYWVEGRQAWISRSTGHGYRIEKSFQCKKYGGKQTAFEAAVKFLSEAKEKKIRELVQVTRSILGPSNTTTESAGHAPPAPYSITESAGHAPPTPCSTTESAGHAPPTPYCTTESAGHASPIPYSARAVSDTFYRIKFLDFLNRWECNGIEDGHPVRKSFSADNCSRADALREALRWYLRHSAPTHSPTYQMQLILPKGITWQFDSWLVRHTTADGRRCCSRFNVDGTNPPRIALAAAVKYRDSLIETKVEALMQIYKRQTSNRQT
ncbi:MAG: uncharacterized protein KVP18_002732 [Porospora cf. gigantea A]|nr:MAG: hypothetical protein KVP18_002732 [Porospora cf. gigantea A]